MRGSEKKSDLLAILPDAIRQDFLWHAADGGPYEVFRNMILAQTQKTPSEHAAGHLPGRD